ncbi:hypothetical protein [Achromobacter sp. JUb104]|uniref:hypothetical protein n=1 Tax=Achromobacter sp. JUb104 TaxID=2940590 RepID=UPI002169C077|nr:hypothetical protein [Achromobacter sp. JUb104]MCS3509244.1 hypothetical protein [Achromobacter sp. JUb104]
MTSSMKGHRQSAIKAGVESLSRRLLTRLALILLLFIAAGAASAECRLSISNPEIDYGALYRGELLAQGRSPMLALNRRDLTLTAICDTVTPLALRFLGDAAGPNSYRFAANGNFTIRLRNATVDGNRIELAQTAGTGGALSSPSASVLLTPGSAVSPVALGQAASGKVFTAQIEFDTCIDEPATRVRDVTILEGGGVFELVRADGKP